MFQIISFIQSLIYLYTKLIIYTKLNTKKNTILNNVIKSMHTSKNLFIITIAEICMIWTKDLCSYLEILKQRVSTCFVEFLILLLETNFDDFL